MAILSRRALQSLIDDSPIRPDALSKLVGRLNLGGKQSLDAEWELIILSALSRVGLVEHEPELGGDAKLDFLFRDPSGMLVAADITSISDDEANRRNPVDHLTRELHRRSDERRLEGNFSIQISSEVGGNRSHKNEVLLRLPPPHKFKQYIFDAGFEEFLDRIAQAPRTPHEHRVDNEEACLTINYSHGRGGFSYTFYADYKAPRDIVRNPLYNRLKKKASQLRKASANHEKGFSGVLICDGGSTVFQPTVGAGVFGLDQIAKHFLRRSESLDFVGVVGIRDPLSTATTHGERYTFDVRIIEAKDYGVDNTFGALIRQGLRQLPQPSRTPVNARSKVERQAAEGVSALGYDDRQGGCLSHGKLAISSRAVIDYLTGRIDESRFRVLTDAWGLSILRRDLDAGGLVDAVQLSRLENQDDDELIFSWRKRDESVAPFAVTIPPTSSS